MKITDKLIKKLALVAVVYFTPIVIVIKTKNNNPPKRRESKNSLLFTGNIFLCKKINDTIKAIKNLKLIICNSVE